MPLNTVKSDPSARPVTCEACGATTADNGQPLTVGNSYSIVACFATTGPEPAPGAGYLPGGVQCPAEQHYCCSAACAVAAHKQCLDEHLAPAFQAARAAHTATWWQEQQKAAAAKEQP